MSDLPNDITPEEPQTPRSAPRKRTHKRKAPVFTYLIVLFLAAFLLLAMSYFMQQRKLEGMDASLAGLKDSVSAMQTVEAMQEDNSKLRAQVAELEEQLKTMTTERNDLSSSLEEAFKEVNEAQNETIALEWLLQIQAYYEQKYYRYARPLIQRFNAYGLQEYLPTIPAATESAMLEAHENITIESPADVYQRIVDALYPDGIPPLEEE
ncbi:MAG: hypothetical protein HFF18_00455 [Oscillospiraceae bacterium]|nr:hypothetical protein [Oscillospiraceae bacterium]